MGYYTHYELTTDHMDDTPIKYFCRECDSAAYALGYDAEDDDFDGASSCKWYENREDLVAFSKKWPDVLFTLSGEGEESGDIWKLYVKNGKSQYEAAKITIADYNPSKMT